MWIFSKIKRRNFKQEKKKSQEDKKRRDESEGKKKRKQVKTNIMNVNDTDSEPASIPVLVPALMFVVKTPNGKTNAVFETEVISHILQVQVQN